MEEIVWNSDLFVRGAEYALISFNFVLGLLFVSQVLRARKPPGSILAWILFIVLVPYFGVILYILVGERKTRMQQRLRQKRWIEPDQKELTLSTEVGVIEKILQKAKNPGRSRLSGFTLLDQPQSAYADLIALLNGATHQISMTMYIFANDSIGHEFFDVLCKKAQEGVQVRLLLDGFGSLFVSRKRLRQLTQAGGAWSFFSTNSHLRNHRKLLLVDGEYAILGGMNIGREYLRRTRRFKKDEVWIDLALRVSGDIVKDLEEVFFSDWKFATGKRLEGMQLGPKQKGEKPAQRDGQVQPAERWVQVAASGPDQAEDCLYDALLSRFFAARERIWIATPYFILDEPFAKALELAAKRGVEVKLLVPWKSNHWIADVCRRGYLRQLQQAGAQICALSDRMLHAKALVVDADTAFVGSANMDMRSLLINFELGLFLYSRSEIEVIENWFQRHLAVSKRWELKSNWALEVLEGIGRVIGPVL